VAAISEFVKPMHEIGILVKGWGSVPPRDDQQGLVADPGIRGETQELFTGGPAARVEIVKGDDQ
jgi:hypothetical protein